MALAKIAGCFQVESTHLKSLASLSYVTNTARLFLSDIFQPAISIQNYGLQTISLLVHVVKDKFIITTYLYLRFQFQRSNNATNILCKVIIILLCSTCWLELNGLHMSVSKRWYVFPFQNIKQLRIYFILNKSIKKSLYTYKSKCMLHESDAKETTLLMLKNGNITAKTQLLE